MPEFCRLREMDGESGHVCDGERCLYWRALDHIGTVERPGCALQFFELLGDDGVVSWLLSVKRRIEGDSA